MPLRPRAGVPTVTIGGRKYVLSTDGGALGDRMDDAALQEEYGPRVIMPDPTANKWRYLWAYDTDRQTLTMWRVSDGSEKVSGSAKSEQARIVALEKKGQLNRVTRQEFTEIHREMRRREDDAIKAMQKWVESMKSEATRQLDVLVREYFDKQVLPKLRKELKDVQSGVTPIGFKPFGRALEGDPVWLLRQKSSHVLGEVFRRYMSENKVEAWIKAQGFDLNLVGIQDLSWAIDDIRDEAVRYLPDRPDED